MIKSHQKLILKKLNLTAPVNNKVNFKIYNGRLDLYN